MMCVHIYVSLNYQCTYQCMHCVVRERGGAGLCWNTVCSSVEEERPAEEGEEERPEEGTGEEHPVRRKPSAHAEQGREGEWAARVWRGSVGLLNQARY